jgi:acetyl esterase
MTTFAPRLAKSLKESAMPLDQQKLFGLDPTTTHFLQSLEGAPPIYTLTPAAARQVLRKVQDIDVPTPDVSFEDRALSGGPTGKVSIRIVRPKDVRGDLPVILFTHGGGWILGDKDTHFRLVSELAAGARAAVVFVDYDPSPEARFPVPIEQAYTALQWVAGSEGQGFDPTRLVLAGDSVGGHMAAELAMRAKDRKGPHVDLQVLIYPVTNADFDTESYRLFADGPWLTREAMKWFWNAFAPDEAARKQPDASPLRASLEQLRGLPPALVLTNEFDVLRDEGEAYAHKLSAAGVPVAGTRHFGAIHDLVLLNPIAQTAVARGMLREAISTIRQVFESPDEFVALRSRAARAAAPLH